MSYSIVGRSNNDACIVHKKNYKSEGQVIGGIITGLTQNGNRNKYEDWIDALDGIITSGGIIEFKRKEYNTDQTVGEALKSAGGLVARVLIEGEKVEKVAIYGLAGNYKEKRANMLVLHIDFTSNKAQIIMAPDALPLHSAFNWLLNCINLN